jgi:DNA invertase Pin-like site-specific DNA recombinase
MKAYGYARVSTDEQEQSSDNQIQRLSAYISSLGLECGGVFADEAVSASKNPMETRKEGKKLWDLLQPGDMVVITHPDRAFRSQQDSHNTLALWRKLGVKVRFLDLNLDLDTPEGGLMFGVISAAAEYEARMTGRRVRAIYAYMKKNNIPFGPSRPWGWTTKDRSYVPCEKERELGTLVMVERDSGLSWAAIALKVQTRGTRKPQCKAGSKGWYTRTDVRRLYHAAQDGYPIRPQESLPIVASAETPF